MPGCAEQVVEAIRARMRREQSATAADLDAVDAALEEAPRSASLWILRGDLIQIAEGLGPDFELEDALDCYRRAAELAPHDPRPAFEIACFHYNVMDDAEAALPFMERAVALGGVAEASRLLERLRRELSGAG